MKKSEIDAMEPKLKEIQRIFEHWYPQTFGVCSKKIAEMIGAIDYILCLLPFVRKKADDD